MKLSERFAFVALFMVTVCVGTIGVYLLFTTHHAGGKWIASTGLLCTLAGVFQLDVSGFFDEIIEHYCNEKKFPNGPPSRITREIIDNPDRPVATWLRNTCFFNVRTGFWFIVVGTSVQLAAVWL